MRDWLLLFIITIFLTILETTIVPARLILLVVLGVSLLLPEKQSLVFAFLAGLILDLVAGQTLGLSSFGFLIVSLFTSLYRRKFRAQHPAYLLPFTFFSLWLFAEISRQMFFWQSALLNTLLILIFLPLLRFCFPGWVKAGLQLPLKP